MKKHFSFIGLISIMLITGTAVISCGGAGSPSSAVKKLHTAIEKDDLKSINELMTPQAAQIMIMMGEKSKGAIAAYGGIEKTEEIINGNNAVVKVTYKNGETSDFNLVKIDGKWKVNIEK